MTDKPTRRKRCPICGLLTDPEFWDDRQKVHENAIPLQLEIEESPNA